MTVEAQPRAAQPVRHDIDWSPVAGAVVWMPPEHRVPTVDEATATRMLRCTPASFARLRDLGLEATDTADGPRYDANDVRNAGLYSCSGRTEVEVALGAVLSFLRGGDADLFADRGWTYEMRAESDTDVLLHVPTPEVFGGATVSALVDGVPPAPAGDRVRVPGGHVLRGSLVTSGRRDALRDPRLVDITAEFLAGGTRWHYLSPGLKGDAHAAYARGVGNCDTMCVVLAERLAAAGFEPRVYRGWIVGITEVPHSWIELTDADGREKVIDPSLLVLARHARIGSPDFAGKALGSALSRVVPTRCSLADAVGVTAGGDPCAVRFTCRPSGAVTR